MNDGMRVRKEPWARIRRDGRLDARSRLARTQRTQRPHCRECGIILDESECTPEASDLCESCEYRLRTGKMLIRGMDFTQGYLMRESMSVDRRATARKEYVRAYNKRLWTREKQGTQTKEMA